VKQLFDKYKPWADAEAIGLQPRNLEFDLILGNDFLNVVVKGVVHRISEALVIKDTKFGYLLSGALSTGTVKPQMGACLSILNKTLSVFSATLQGSSLDTLMDQVLRNFYEQEALSLVQGDLTQSQADQEIWQTFIRNLEKSSDGRYIIKLPWKDDSILPSQNEQLAVRRYSGTLKKLKGKPELFKQYSDCFVEWEKIGVIEKATKEEFDKAPFKALLPHHAVLRPDHQTMKCRVVFDASASQDKDKWSINQCLETGPNLIPRLDGTLLRLRFGKYIVVGDLTKAFFQLQLNDQDVNKVFFIWSEEFGKPWTECLWKFKRLTWGLNCAPFCLLATLHHHLDSWPEDKELLQKIKKNLYMDDVLVTFDTAEEAIEAMTKAFKVFDAAHFKLIKVRSNCEKLMEFLKTQEGRTAFQESKVLGALYDEKDDSFCISCQTMEQLASGIITKRVALAIHSTFFDPLGLASPWHVKAKILLQETWEAAKGSWDAPLAVELQEQWKVWAKQAPSIAALKIPRQLATFTDEYVLHYFCDASGKAHAVVVYL